MVEEAGQEDAYQIACLHVASWQGTYTQELSNSFLQHQDLDVRTAEWRRRISEGVTVLLVKERGAVIGFVACGLVGQDRRDTADWEIFNLHVAPHRHGEGLGTQLFDASAHLGRSNNARDLILWVVETNRKARAFYEHKGMRWDGGEQQRVLTAKEKLREVRYRMPLAAIR